ncbi:hypothetical protein INR49_027236 [Caranx melampygus]|nr:hypothetical protein INR49_027236 [Caranx melampygus]
MAQLSMTAAAGVLTGLAKLKRQDSARSQHRPFPPASPGLGNPAPEAAPRKRKRRTDVVVVRGRLRLYSPSGFFLLLGLVILAIGIGMATLGYWPHSETMPSARSVTGGSSHTAAAGGAKHPSQVKEMELMCPSQMGRWPIPTQVIMFKIIHMRDMYSTVIDIHRLRQKEQKQQHHRNSTYGREAGDLRTFGAASGSLLAFSRAGGSAGGAPRRRRCCWGMRFHRHRDQAKLDCSFASLLAPLYKDHGLGGPGLGLTHSDSIRHQWSVDGDGEKGGHHARSIVSSSISAFTLPVIKLNNCVIDEPEMEVITEEDRGGDRRDGERLLAVPRSSEE